MAFITTSAPDAIVAAPVPLDEVTQLRGQLAIQQETIRRLKMDMEALNMKYVAEIEHAAETLYEKDRVEQELEELSCRLFEQANEMVAQEKREKRMLERQLIMFQEHHLPPINDQQLDVFRSFVSAITSGGNSSPTTDLRRMAHQHAFLKIALEQDVEPCLKRYSGRLSRRLMDHLVRQQPCTIERANTVSLHHRHHLGSPAATHPSSSSSSLWDRFLSSTTTATSATSTASATSHGGCSACGQNNEPLLYRFKLDVNEEWQYMDQHCRDRLVAVCEFYAFLRNIQLGLYADHSLHDMYQENVRLRLQMFYARMGARVELAGIQQKKEENALRQQDDDNDDHQDTRSISTISSSSTAGPPHTPIQSSPLQENDKHPPYTNRS
ncbi:hypothetical protein BX666DRAFT_1984826 [Dichotomocladium elegans]|nr:hypothetical protein BX666DRAFT_1984826 [Dichotomocladium elegans]